jgi:hypothetical protein
MKENKLKISWLVSAVSALLIIALFLFSSFNQPRGAITETVGLIESVGGVPKKHGPTKIIASVRLNDGSIIRAHVLSGVIAQKRRIAHVRVFRRFLSGTQVYEVYNTEQAN